MGRYLIKINELNEKNKYLDKNITEIRECVSNMNKLKDNICWKSPSQEKFMVKYDEYMETLKIMLENLESCLKVTKKYHENYSTGYQKIKSEFKKVTRDLEVEHE